MNGCSGARGSAPRRVLKSVVGPALGATLAALLAVTPAACSKTTKAPEGQKPTPREPDRVGSVAVSPDAAVLPAPGMPPLPIDAGVAEAKPDIPEPGTTIPKVGKTPPRHIPKPGKIPPPGKPPIPDPGTMVPGAGTRTNPGHKVGIKIDTKDDGAMLRPTRPTRRATDPTYQPMSGSGPRRLA